MTRISWERIDELFQAACELDSEARAEFLDRECQVAAADLYGPVQRRHARRIAKAPAPAVFERSDQVFLVEFRYMENPQD